MALRREESLGGSVAPCCSQAPLHERRAESLAEMLLASVALRNPELSRLLLLLLREGVRALGQDWSASLIATFAVDDVGLARRDDHRGLRESMSN